MTLALDDAAGRVSVALKAKPQIYRNSILVFSSDNGGPAETANNWPLRGAKFSTFEGGVRAAAFVHSPLLPARLLGGAYGGLIHISDWWTTFAALTGVNASEPSGPVPPDGFDVWRAITTNASSPRSSIVHELDHVSGIYAYRSGPYKLSWGEVCAEGRNGTSRQISNCVVGPIRDHPGQGCVHLLPPRSYSRGNDWGDWDEGPRRDGPCTEAAPCLFHVEDDPTESTNLAAAAPEVVTRLRAELSAIDGASMPVGLDHASTTPRRLLRLDREGGLGAALRVGRRAGAWPWACGPRPRGARTARTEVHICDLSTEVPLPRARAVPGREASAVAWP
jgi:hypothetical protein